MAAIKESNVHPWRGRDIPKLYGSSYACLVISTNPEQSKASIYRALLKSCDGGTELRRGL